jgi:hypothetical protein
MLKHDSSEEKKHIAQIHTKERSLQNAQEQRIKKDIIDIQEKAIYESHENKLVYTYVLKDIQKKFIR